MHLTFPQIRELRDVTAPMDSDSTLYISVAFIGAAHSLVIKVRGPLEDHPLVTFRCNILG